jgi:L-2,4-diaminobutyrate decarboxylase
MHHYDVEIDRLARAIIDEALARVRMDPPPLDGPRSHDELRRVAGTTITEDGLGGEEALRLFRDVLAPACISVDHPRFLAFVPAAPTEAAILVDLLVAASSLFGGTWLESAGAVYAENEALAFLAAEMGLPDSAGGVFVQGGTNGNLSALVAARHHARGQRSPHPRRWSVLTGEEAHSSVESAARVMDVDVITVPGSDRRLRAEQARATIASLDDETRAGIFAVVATSGSTNLGLVDELDGLADLATELEAWFHVDGAYGAAAVLVPEARHVFHGIEKADSLVVDPHKWLFAPYDCCALLYRDPAIARAAHTQEASYLDPTATGEWNPSDLSHQLTRRARGLPFWFSLATHGAGEYRLAIAASIHLANRAAELIEADHRLDLICPPELSVVAFRRRGWSMEDCAVWSERLLNRGLAFVVPTRVDGEPALRLCFVNPRTRIEDVELILGTLDSPGG